MISKRRSRPIAWGGPSPNAWRAPHSRTCAKMADLGANGTVPLGIDATSGVQLLLGQIQAMEETGRIDATRIALAVRAYSMTPED